MFGGKGIVRDSEPYVPALLGSAIHAGLAEYYSGNSLASAKTKAVEVFWGECGDTALLQEHSIYVCNLLNTYVLTAEPIGGSVLEVETEFNVPLGEVCYQCGRLYEDDTTRCICGATIFYWSGRVDMVLLKKDKRLHVVDHKTTKSVSTQTMARHQHSFQMLGYAYGVDKSAENHCITGATINFIKTLQDLKAVIAGKRQINVRHEFPLLPFDKHRFLRTSLRLALDIEQEIKRFESDPIDAFPMRPQGCHQYGTCPYISLCWGDVDPDDWFNVKESALLTFKPREETIIT